MKRDLFPRILVGTLWMAGIISFAILVVGYAEASRIERVACEARHSSATCNRILSR